MEVDVNHLSLEGNKSYSYSWILFGFLNILLTNLLSSYFLLKFPKVPKLFSSKMLNCQVGHSLSIKLLKIKIKKEEKKSPKTTLLH